MTDLVERLRKPLGGSAEWTFIGKFQVHRSDQERVEAADEIERLRADNEVIREALVRAYQFISPKCDPSPLTNGEMAQDLVDLLKSGAAPETFAAFRKAVEARVESFMAR